MVCYLSIEEYIYMYITYKIQRSQLYLIIKYSVTILLLIHSNKLVVFWYSHTCVSTIFCWCAGDPFKNTNQAMNEIEISQYIGKIFLWNSKGYLWNSMQNILSIHWMTGLYYNIEISRAVRFNSAYVFLKCSPDLVSIEPRGNGKCEVVLYSLAHKTGVLQAASHVCWNL